jgi:hypothetical protein
MANGNTGKVGEYDATTGALINASFIPVLAGPTALLVSGNTLFVANSALGGSVGEYNASTGAVINATFITPTEPQGLALSGNTLFVLNSNFTVGEYNATTGAAINATLITGLPNASLPNGIAVASVPEPSTWGMIVVGGMALMGIMLRKNHRTA